MSTEAASYKALGFNDRARGNYLCTYSGIHFYPCDPRPDEVVIEDIAKSLGMMCRWAGHVNRFFSVAQHCVLGSLAIESFPRAKEERLPFKFLMHDASEAYCVDLPRPLKYSPELAGYALIEEGVQNAICMRFGLPLENLPSIKEMDNTMLVTEQRDLRNNPQLLADMLARHKVKPLPTPIESWSPYVAEQNFLIRFNQLVGE